MLFSFSVELKHPKYLSSVKPSPPKRCIPNVKCNPPHKLSSKSKLLKTVPNKAFIRIEEINLNEENVKIEEVPLTIPNFNSLPSNKSRLPKITIKKINENKTGENKLSSPLPSPKLSIQVKGNMKKIPNPKGKNALLIVKSFNLPINSSVPNPPFLYPLKTLENRQVF